MKKTIPCIQLFLVITMFIIFIPYNVTAEELERKVENYITKHDQTMAGLTTIIIDNESTSTYMHGHTSIEQNLKVDEATVFEWGSSAKLLIWISVMQLVEDDLLDLQTDIRHYLPEDFVIPNTYEEPITMGHLMNHTAGFDESFTDLMVLDPVYLPSLRETLEETDVQQTFRPGEVVAYSNYGSALAAFVVEKVSGLDFQEYVQENIFTPLEMTETAIDPQQRDNEWVKAQREKIQGYTEEKELIFPSNFTIPLYPAGSVIGTADDFAKIGQFLLTEDGSPLFNKKDTIDKLFEPTAYYPETDIPRIANGLFALPAESDVYGHGGNTNAFSSSIYIDRGNKKGVIVMVNQAYEDTFTVGIPELIFGRADLNSDEKLEDASIWEGIYQPARSPYHGFSKIYGLLNRSSVKVHNSDGLVMNGSYYTQQRPGVYVTEDDYSLYSLDTYATHPTYKSVLSAAYGDLIRIPKSTHIVELTLLITGAFAGLISVVYLLVILIMKISSWKMKLKRISKRIIIQHGLNILVLANIWWMIYSTLGMTTYKALQIPFLINIGYVVVTLGLSGYSIFRRKKSTYNKKQTIIHWITLITALFICVNIVYWEFYW